MNRPDNELLKHARKGLSKPLKRSVSTKTSLEAYKEERAVHDCTDPREDYVTSVYGFRKVRPWWEDQDKDEEFINSLK